MIVLFLIFTAVHSSNQVFALDNGLSLRPYMGFNSWYDVFMNPTQENSIRTIDLLVQKGFKQAGYSYYALDDGVFESRDNVTSELVASSSQFPNGIKYLADYAHSQGFKFGIYTDRGTSTCGGRPGSLGFESLDASFFASLGVDLLKEDSCNVVDSDDHALAFSQYARMRDALNATGRPILFNLCGWHPWYAHVGSILANSWRTGQDDVSWDGVLINIDNLATSLSMFHGGEGFGFNDPDYLLSTDSNGNQALTPLQSRAQFTMYAMLAAPLMISSDLNRMSEYLISTYTNADVIAINQDSLVRAGRRIVGTDLSSSSSSSSSSNTNNTGTNVWARPLHDGSFAFAFINVGNLTTSVTCDTACVGAEGGPMWEEWITLDVKELWTGVTQKVTVKEGIIAKDLEPNGGVAIFRVTPVF